MNIIEAMSILNGFDNPNNPIEKILGKEGKFHYRLVSIKFADYANRAGLLEAVGKIKNKEVRRGLLYDSFIDYLEAVLRFSK